MEIDFKAVNRAFSNQSAGYDTYDVSNDILQWMRSRVRNHVLKNIKQGNRLLELNAGTGLDAVFFVEKGCTVHATDLSDGMVQQIRQKVERFGMGDKLRVSQCSYTNLDSLPEEKFDYIFSNFGGLNCIPDLSVVTKTFHRLLIPGGYVTFVIMPPVCPWEMATVFKGNFKSAFRRFKKEGAKAHLEGEFFTTYYFSPSEILGKFGSDFKKIDLEGLASIGPPPHADTFPKRFPRLYKTLTSIDEKICHLSPFNRWADHFILTVQYLPSK
jgi:ubiquinone/menaquinone biosynthesis C-methylase UbiE